ncbi:hypothetical protein FLJC2902T_10290 [Flavobacterium limnosediminis JC2902]|uniref:Lipoprotein n=1 Tax=Flavobacterium limnosediminis JC2902 TaxID=1341181 RepID=V6SQS4_9FLAO|nr:hypothetical protein [Flavobacterium limnosediminis]ESU28996.1 hypothetical protein FLJC2902T_10290 [Flavobacterium limnosediminis JC2902]
MNKKYFSSLVLAVTISLVSCKKEETAEENTASQKPVPSVYEIVNGTNIAQKPAQMPQQNMTVTPTTTTTVTPPAPVTVAKGMNPPHGQPGHRCDIKVGAPLNSPPGNKTTIQPGAATVQKMTNPSFTVTPSATATSGNTATTAQSSGVPALLNPTTTTTAPGMNPPHGQEGHRCDIAVGAPLTKTEK